MTNAERREYQKVVVNNGGTLPTYILTSQLVTKLRPSKGWLDKNVEAGTLKPGAVNPTHEEQHVETHLCVEVQFPVLDKPLRVWPTTVVSLGKIQEHTLAKVLGAAIAALTPPSLGTAPTPEASAPAAEAEAGSHA